MADEDDDYNGIQVENIDMSELDYDLEYLVRNRSALLAVGFTSSFRPACTV